MRASMEREYTAKQQRKVRALARQLILDALLLDGVILSMDDALSESRKRLDSVFDDREGGSWANV